jgi:hypothetical protein
MTTWQDYTKGMDRTLKRSRIVLDFSKEIELKRWVEYQSKKLDIPICDVVKGLIAYAAQPDLSGVESDK